jgi:hypothetical protein
VKYKLPGGAETSESGFEIKAAALAWGRDQEARIREGRWTDLDAGKITVSEWIDRWLAMQDVGISTVETRGYLIRRFIRPAWGESELASDRMRDDLEHALQARWEESLLARAAIDTRSPVPLVDELLAPLRYRDRPESEPAAPRETVKQLATPGDREKMISKIPPNHAGSPSRGTRLGPKERVPDEVRDQIQRVELRGFEPLTPSMRSKSDMSVPV